MENRVAFENLNAVFDKIMNVLCSFCNKNDSSKIGAEIKSLKHMCPCNNIVLFGYAS